MEKQIEAGNKLVAEFMQEKYEVIQDVVWIPQNIPGISPYSVIAEYHSSWDWLMPVVEKIERLFDENISVVIEANQCSIEIGSQYAIAYDIHLPDDFFSGKVKSKIQATLISIVQFITWYNSLTDKMKSK